MPQLPALSCDRCGASGVERYHFCPRCGLFVCHRCWEAPAEACMSCTRPGLPVGRDLTASIRSTFRRSPTSAQDAPTTRVGRSLSTMPTDTLRPQRTVANPQQREQIRPAPDRAATRQWNLLRIVISSAVLGLALLLLPAVFGTPPPAPSAPSTEEARPTATERPSRRQPTPEPSRTYLVRRGDTLRSIAARVYGDESLWRRIYRANRDRLRSPEGLRVGMELRIPPRR